MTCFTGSLKEVSFLQSVAHEIGLPADIVATDTGFVLEVPEKDAEQLAEELALIDGVR